MASRAATAAKLGAANMTIDGSISRLAKALGLIPPAPIGKAKDPIHRAAMEAERIAGFIAQVADKVDPDGDAVDQVQNAVTPEPPAEGYAPPEVEEPAKQDDDPKIGPHKLSFYEGRSDEQILKLKGVGEATLREIREAQRKA